jgi:hypothetical protein
MRKRPRPRRRKRGAFGDGRSRLSRLAARIEDELRGTYRIETALDAHRMGLPARYFALAENTLDTMDSDPKATRRTATALQKTAELTLAGLRANTAPAASPEQEFAARVRGNRRQARSTTGNGHSAVPEAPVHIPVPISSEATHG